MSETSGDSCSYYTILVKHPYNSTEPYTAECGELIEALELNPYEANIFKEVWRQATARLGKPKQGNTRKRGAEKIIWNGKRLLNMAERNKDAHDSI